MPRSRAGYRLCRSYVDRYNGDNDGDFRTNGEFQLARRVLPRAKVVLDVGSNAGQWAQLALSINPAIQLHCFEPDPSAFAKLAAQPFPPGVVRNHFGLGSARADTRLFVFTPGAGINSLYRRSGLEDGWDLPTQGAQVPVHLETLDAYCSENGIDRVDFCKLDVEGHELEVLKGASGSLHGRAFQLIQFEYGGCNIDSHVLLKDIFEFFGQYEYTLYKIRPKYLQRLHRYDQRLENFQYQNWLAVSPACSIGWLY